MTTNLPIPTIEDVQRINENDDPLVRNLQITQCYYELSDALNRCMGLDANWCTFATWASKQAGQTIRKEDFERLLESGLSQSRAARQVAVAVNDRGGESILGPQDPALYLIRYTPAVDRASDAVGRGNKKVFEEIGYAFARFYQTCFRDQVFDPQALDEFCAEFRAGDPPDGQTFLRQAFLHYAQALADADPKTRAEQILLANLEIGFHEQVRLQPEIGEAMDAGLVSFLEFTRPLFRRMFPAGGWFHLAYLYLMRLLGRPTDLDKALQAFLAEVRVELQRVITRLMMTMALPSGVVLQLGEDLRAGFPEALKEITNQELNAFLEQHDRSSGSTRGTGAVDWADLPDRLNYIIGLFRSYQEQQDLFAPPFTLAQTATLKAGRRPDGRL